MAAAASAKQMRPSKDPHVYGETLMYGQYKKDLGEFARREAARVRIQEERQEVKKRKASDRFKSYKESKWTHLKRKCDWCVVNIIGRIGHIGEDWIFLTTLGTTMALLSFLMDYCIEKCLQAYSWSYAELEWSPGLQYLVWVAFPLVFICFSTGFVHLVGPNAIGSGIPEMKTILRGVVLKEYLTFKTLISKMVGLCTSLGSGLPIGKEGPFVHVASITANMLATFVRRFRSIHENESRNSEMLAAACAVGVACTFAAPIGGVLFSIEVTATFFAVRNYWRGFYAAVCGAFVFRMLAIIFKDEETLTALFKTSFRQDLPFDPIELLAFSFIGVVSGFAGALFVYLHRKIVEFIRQQKRMTEFLQRNRFIFPSIVVLFLSSLTFPLGLGQYMAGHLPSREAVNELFSNVTWAHNQGDNIEHEKVLRHWKGPHDNLFVTLSLFIIMRFWMSALAITLPVPAGVFMPVFTIGAAFGRLVGESMAAWFPDGISDKHIVPGGYAIVGAAALAGSVTHTVSTSVIVFELTGQMGHVLPCIIAVLIANAIAHFLQYSIYDSLINIKKLPYLPDIINAQAINAHSIHVEDFMVRNVRFVTLDCTYRQLFEMLKKHRYRDYPLVDTGDSMILLGSMQRVELERLVVKQLMIDEPSFDKLPEVFMANQGIINNSRTRTISANSDTPSLKARFAVARVDSVSSNKGESTSPERTQSSVRSKRTASIKSQTDGSTSPTADVTAEFGPPKMTVRQTSLLSRVGSMRSKAGQSIRRALNIHHQDEVDAAVELELAELPFTLDDIDSIDELTEWELYNLDMNVSFDDARIDPAPFQLVEKTTLYRVHSIFSLLSLHHLYVTNTGRLVGMVAMKEVRDAIQGQVTGSLPSKSNTPQNTPLTSSAPQTPERHTPEPPSGKEVTIDNTMHLQMGEDSDMDTSKV